MTQNQSDKKIIIRNSMFILLSAIGLMVCIAVLFPQVREMIVDWAGQILHKNEVLERKGWLRVIFSSALGGICFILFFDYCTLTDSGRALVQKVKQEMKDCLSEIDFRSLLRPVLLIWSVYLLGILTIIRANFLFRDDIWRSVLGGRGWYDWNRYVSEFASIFVHADTNLTDISPLPQLLAVFILSIGSVLLVYVMGNGKITAVRLLASIPLGLSPYFLECLSFKFDAPYMAFSILASIVPFLFIARRKAFLFSSVVSLLLMCMSYQAASGVYLLIVMILGFKDWNSRKKSNKEIGLFLGTGAFAFCFAMLLFRFFFMKPTTAEYVPSSSAMYPASYLIPGIWTNIKNYAMTINGDLGIIWKVGIVIVCILFIIKSIKLSLRKKILSFFVSILLIGLSFILSYGVYLLLEKPLYDPRALYGFGIFLSIVCIYVVSDFKKIAIVAVLALNWCLLVFALSYGNALADQSRYGEFRIGILLHDLSTLFPDRSGEGLSIQMENSIEYAPSVKNVLKHYPIIKRLVPVRLGDNWDMYFLEHFNHSQNTTMNNKPPVNRPGVNYVDFGALNLPVVLDSYYHTIKSDGNHVLVILKH